MARNRRPRRRPPTPPPSPHIVAFMDQVDAAVRAGDLPAGIAVHLDVVTLAGAPVGVRLRLCSASLNVDCPGACA